MKIKLCVRNGYSVCISHYSDGEQMNILRQIFPNNNTYSSPYLKFNRKRMEKCR